MANESNRTRSPLRNRSPARGIESHEKMIQQALAGLQLPHMPQAPPISTTDSSASIPSIRILLVSDVDLPSASALAEYTLLQNNQVFDASRIDLCIACGPFCRDEDLLPYLKGKSRKQLQHLFEEDKSNRGNHSHPNKGNRSGAWSSVFFRSQEETAAMEGLVTAAISQLESIVCRVVFCPGNSDPLSASASPDDLRFTPNSRNVHRQWLPLAPGLGCAGLLFLDAPTNSSGVLQLKPPPGRRANQSFDYDSEEEVHGEREYIPDPGYINHHHHHHQHHRNHYHHQSKGRKPTNTSRKLTNVHGNDGIGPDSYCQTLERLIQNAPAPQQHYPFETKLSQTILITHYYQPPRTIGRRKVYDSDDEDDDDDEVRIFGNIRKEESPDMKTDDKTTHVIEEVFPKTNVNRANQEDEFYDNDDDEESNHNNCHQSTKPWPREHSKFLESPTVQEHLALEIASGGGTQRPKEMQRGDVRIIIPGSLRERGEFCLVDMSLMEQAVKKNMTASAAPSAKKKKTTFSWTVRNVDFHTMERLP